ncbi:MAG: 3-phosphate cyclase [Myxococcaceae bacterium]|nr:3-phosphate cyclase [Myxococcaceae bacterium]
MMSTCIHIDGARGGGQILRSALSLSAFTGRPFVIEAIRAGRKRDGLLRQHLTAVRAAATICAAEVCGAELGSRSLRFAPGPVLPGSYRFAVGSAGSACLVLQTVLPPLLLAREPSTLRLEGGTHNPLAPPYPFLDRVFFPLLEQMGVGIARTLERPGFYPAGGGAFEVGVRPAAALKPLALCERGALRRLSAEAQVANLSHGIATRQLAIVRQALQLEPDQLSLRTPEADGPGNALFLLAEFEHASELVTGFGMPGQRAEQIAHGACRDMQSYLRAGLPVGEHLADQLLIPFALAGAGSFRTLALSDHARTNIEVIESFLPVRFELARELPGQLTVRVGSADPGACILEHAQPRTVLGPL